MWIRSHHWLATLIVFGLSIQAQTATGQKPKPTNNAQLSIQSVIPSQEGISISMTAGNVDLLYVQLDKQNPGTGSWVPVVPWTQVVLTNELKNTTEPTQGTILVPIVVEPNPSLFYRVTLDTKSEDSTEMDWNISIPMTFHGYESTVSQTFNLKFASDALTVSAVTKDVVTLTAEWQIQGETVVSSRESVQRQSPQLQLSFAALQSAKGSTPSLILTLEDAATHRKQEARITIAVSSTSDLKQKVSNAANGGSNGGSNDKKVFSWKDLAKTGVGAMLQYFSAI